MTALAEAIRSLINGAPRSPTVAELDSLISQHVPETIGDEQAFRIDPSVFVRALAKGLRPDKPRLLVDQKAVDDLRPYLLDVRTIIIHAPPLLLIDPQRDDRTISGMLIHPPRIYIAYYDQEFDYVALHRMTPWKAIEAAVPKTYQHLIRSWQTVKGVAP